MAHGTYELYHHGIKGQKWGVRRFQNTDGSLTSAGRKRYADEPNSNKPDSLMNLMDTKVSYLVNYTKTQVTGKQYVDTYLEQGTTFSRIQTSENFEKFAFYATYKDQDSDKYMGLFGKNLTRRAQGEARRAEKDAQASGNEEDIENARQLREKANNTKVYQLKIEATKKLKIPSDENASNVVRDLLNEKEFKDNLIASIEDSKEKMKRPQQQLLFKEAQNALNKKPNDMTSSEKVAVYKAFNLSLVNHNQQEVAAQNRFYGELKKKGYNALLDYNDKEYSSYHAKRPMIVFDTDSVKLQAITETNPKIVNKLYKKYNTERIIKEIPANTIGLIDKFGSMTVSQCQNYMDKRMNDYLSG